MVKSVKETSLEKGGEVSAWNFGKFHNVKHVQLWIIVLGWVEICSGQSVARGHMELLTPWSTVSTTETFLLSI